MAVPKDNPQAASNTFNKGLVTDLDKSYQGEGTWTHARNAVNNSLDGKVGAIGNEPANISCITLPYELIGAIPAYGDTWVLFTTNDVDSEIGLFTESECKYETVVNNRCLGFDRRHLITGTARRTFDCSVKVYWQDALNPDRVMDVKDPPYIINKVLQGDCYIDVSTGVLDCDKLRLVPLMTIPQMYMSKGRGAGTLPNGTYQLFAGYAVNSIRITDYIAQSNPISVWHHDNICSGVQVEIQGSDPDFDEIELVMVSTVNGQTLARRLGIFSARQSMIYVDSIDPTAPIIKLSDLLLDTPSYEKSDYINSVGDYLLRSGIYTRPDINYQPQANNIKVLWNCVEREAKYYGNGGAYTSYAMDEQYALFIRWVYDTGERTASFHIPGRPPTASDMQLVATADAGVEQYLGLTPYRWRVENTATVTSLPNIYIQDGLLIAAGRCGYWEAETEIYPDNQPEIWGNLCGKKVRHHKMPDATVSPLLVHYKQGGGWVHTLNLQFYDVEYPKDKNGQPIPGIVGYEFLRGSREGNKTILAKGMLNNMRGYDIPEGGSYKGLYMNFPFNDRGGDFYHTTNQGIMQNGRKFDDLSSPLYQVYNDIFTFHSPDTNFARPYLNATELKVYNVMMGTADAIFEECWHHPKFKLMTNFSGTLLDILAVIAALNAMGTAASQQISISGDSDVPMDMGIANPFQNFNSGGVVTGDIAFIQNEIQFFAQVAVNVMAIQAMVAHGVWDRQITKIFLAFVKEQQYAIQYNGHAHYDRFVTSPKGNLRRSVDASQYVGSGLQEFGASFRINNVLRAPYVAVQTRRGFTFTDEQNGFSDSSVFDFSRIMAPNASTPGGATIGIKKHFSWTRHSDGSVHPAQVSSYYAALKVSLPNQYGPIDTIKQVPIWNYKQIFELAPGTSGGTDSVSGGDVYVGRYTEKNPFPLFNNWLVGEPDLFVYDYRQAYQIPFTRYWVYSTPDQNDLFMQPHKHRHLTRIGYGQYYVSVDDFFTNPFNAGLYWMKDAYFYLHVNSVRDFFVESEINVGYRDWEDVMSKRHYDPERYTDLANLFRSDVMKENQNFFKYDFSLSINRFYNQHLSQGKLLPRDFDPEKAETCYSYYNRRVIYSLPQKEELKRDNWLYFLVNNYKDFPSIVSSIKPIGGNGALVMMEDSPPVQMQGTDTLQTTGGIKVSVGDGGLFNQPLQALAGADKSFEYASCQSTYGVMATPRGVFWPSQNAGKVFGHTEKGLEEISSYGMRWWFAKYLPSYLLAAFPDYPYPDNPVIGVGCQMIYDSTNEVLYLTKRDFRPLGFVCMEPKTGTFYPCLDGPTVPSINAGPASPGANPMGINIAPATGIVLGDPNYFEDASWTISYDVKYRFWISWHDWHPNLMIPARDHFFTAKGRGVWKHNDRHDLFCNYYDEVYGFEVGFIYNSGMNVATLRSIEYMLDTYRYKANGRDKYQVLDYGFNRAMIHTDEQNSGMLILEDQPKNDPVGNLQFPQYAGTQLRVLQSKEEQKYRFNGFWDATKNRGEFVPNTIHMMATGANGYTFQLNPLYFDYNKSPLERKRLRNYSTNVWLRRTLPADNKMIFKFSQAKINPSYR